MRIIRSLLCACLVQLFVSSNATAQSTPAADSIISAIELGRAPAEPIAYAPVVFALPEHTGFRTLAKATMSDFVAFPKRKSTWVFLASGAGAALLAHQADGGMIAITNN